MLTAEELSGRGEEIRTSPDLTALFNRLVERAAPVLTRMPTVPQFKALLTADGGVCPSDGNRLEFDPWSPAQHRCPRCGKQYTGDRHDQAWAHYQHLWVAERAAHLAAIAVFGRHTGAASRANELLRAYEGYLDYPNLDNVLGPSRLFFSTYLESVWIGNYLAAATLLREGGLLDDATSGTVSTVADEAANLIGEYAEGLSNRQTWHNAALASIAVWFEDEELASRVIEGPAGIVSHLLRGFGEDGMWYEGDNYHLFALRGQLLAMRWARQAGVDLLADDRLTGRVAAALRAPAVTALPDVTFPARKDSRFAVSLAQPMYLELWEVGLGRMGAGSGRNDELRSWLRRLYASPAPPAQTFDSYLHEAGESPPRSQRSRADLSWWALLEMAPSLPPDSHAWTPGNAFIEGQGLAVLRQGERYASLECGAYGGAHGHPDRLNLVFHADGEYWLPDFGTGSYVARDLFWYRSTLAHNAPRLDGVSQPYGDAVCDSFDVSGAWAWVRGRYRELTRTVVAGPTYVLDLVELVGTEDKLLELPWHLSGRVEVETGGQWVRAELSDEFVHQVERLVPASEGGSILLRSSGCGSATLRLHLNFEGELLRALGPGAPGSTEPAPFYLVRIRGKNHRLVSVLESGKGAPLVRGVQTLGTTVTVDTSEGTDRHLTTVDGWEVRRVSETVRLRGSRRVPAPFEPLVVTDRPLVAHGVSLPVPERPALGGSLEGFDTSEPLFLDHEDQYRRSEEPYAGPEEFSATVWANWNEEALYLATEVTKAEVIARDPHAAPLRLDNEPDEIHSDGVQVYLRFPSDDVVYGFLVLPSSQGGLLARGASGTGGAAEMVQGGWEATETGYRMTLAITLPEWNELRPGDEIGFDLLVNEMRSGRQRRAGQLVWSGGGGWVWLRGDRQDPGRFGKLELR
ncbi:MAG TPA: heparinase II/III family protein [Gemmatimonadales bacterium]|nr:heparinase II/III family protein [Gemmatimonadales bacterium]